MQRIPLTFIASLLIQTLPVFGDPATIVERVRPNESFKHEIEVKLPGDRNFRTISIAGPRLWSKLPASKSDTASSAPPEPIYNWYKIIDSDVGNTASQPIYFLTPTTVLGRARAEGGDAGNILIAFRIPEENQIGLKQKSNGQLVLRPVEQRHHDEIFAIKEPRFQYVVRDTPPKPLNGDDGEISTVDQFGLHSAKRLSTPYQVELTGDH